MPDLVAAEIPSENQLQKNLNWLKTRWLIALVGMVLLVAGQFKLAGRDLPEAPPLRLGAWLNDRIHLGDPGVDNVLYGLPLILAGGAMLTVALRGIHMLPANRSHVDEKPLAWRSILPAWPWVLGGVGTFLLLLLRLNDPDYRWLHVPAWIVSLAIFGVITAVWDRHRGVDLSPRLARADLIWLLGLLTAGVIIGAYRLQGLPDQLIGDEGNFWTVARDIAKGKFNPSIFAPGVYTFPVFSSILQAWFLRVFGVSLWGWRFGSVLMGIATVPPLYLLAREAFDRRIAIAASIVLITSPYFIAFSRLGYNNIQALFFTTLTMYWLYTGLFRRSSLFLLLAGITAGLGFYTYFAARGALIISVAFIVLLWFMRNIRFKDAALALGLLALGWGLTVIPHLVHGYHQDPQAMGFKAWESVFFNTFNGLQFYSSEELFSAAPPIQVNGNELFYNPQIYLVLIARGLARTLLAFQKPGLISEHFIAFPLAGTSGVIFYMLGIALTIYTIRQPRSLLLMLWFTANVLGLSALNTVPPRHTHMVAIIPALALLTGIGLNAIAAAAASMHFKLRRFRPAFLAGVMALAGIWGLYDYFISMPDQYLPQPDQVISWAQLDSHGEKFAYLYSDPAQKDYSAYIGEEFLESIAYETIPAADLVNGRIPVSDQPAIFFFPVEIQDDVTPALARQWGDRLISRTFYSTNGTPVLAAAMNTPFVFERDKTLATILRDSYLHPSLLLLIALLLICLALTAVFPDAWLRRIPTPFKRFINWFNAPGQAATEANDISDWTDELIVASRRPGATQADPPDWSAEPAAQKETFSGLAMLPMHVPQAIWLIGAIASAGVGQYLIANQFPTAGTLAYLTSAAAMVVWVKNNPKWATVFARQVRMTPRAEMYLLAALILAVIATRFFDLNYRVYGLEADETKWTVQSWYSTILRVDRGEFASMHYRHVPVDFWVRSVFMRLFGLNFISARIESATLSLIAVLFLYLLVRTLTGSPGAALLASLLYGLSFIELNAAHQALHNTPPAAWMMAALFFLVWGVRDRTLWRLQVAGILIGLGMLTYESFYPVPVLALTYLAGLAIYGIARRTARVKDWALSMAAVAWPVILVYFAFTRNYMLERQYYHFGWLKDTVGDGLNIAGTLTYLLNNTGEVLTTTFSRVLWADSLLNWPGPLVNPVLLPFVAVGFVYNLWNIRRPHYLFIVLWYALETFPGPILLGSAWPRVMYMGLAPLMIWGALGLWTTFAVLRTVFDAQPVRLAAPLFGLLILMIAINDYRIFSSALADPEERQKRRELAALTADSASAAPLILLPYIAGQNDSAEVESHVLLYSVAGARGLGLQAEDHFRQVELKQLLSVLWESRIQESLEIIFDKSAPMLRDERTRLLDIVLECYPRASLETSGRFFDVYRIEGQALSGPSCYSPAPPVLTAPADGVVLPSAGAVMLRWEAGTSPVSGYRLTLERKLDQVHWIEVEQAFIGPGWPAISNFTEGFHGSGFLLDEWQAGEATYLFRVPQEGQYRIWIRSYKRRANDQHNFVSIAGHRLEFAQNGSPLDQWAWQDLGKIGLQAGDLPIVLTRTYGADEQYSVFIDTLVISSDLEFEPDQDELWKTVLDTPELGSSVSTYTLPELLPPGDYRWKVRIYNGELIVDSSGERGVESKFGAFRIAP